MPPSSTNRSASTQKRRRRSASLVSVFKKLLPENKPERGGTLRKHGFHYSDSLDKSPIPTSLSSPSVSQANKRHSPPERLARCNTALSPPPPLPASAPSSSSVSPSTRSTQLYLERREKRRQRRSLKESGDFLGVQGINPSTGEMDVLTPSTSSASSPFAPLARMVQSKRDAYESARRALRSEKMRRWEMDKEALKAERRRKVRWRRAGEGWSSAVEPELSPIEGSSAATTPREGEKSTDTIVRTPVRTPTRVSSNPILPQNHLQNPPRMMGELASPYDTPSSWGGPNGRRIGPNSTHPSSSVSPRGGPASTSQSNGVTTFRGKQYHEPKNGSDGKICLHTHHHHYWIISGSDPLQQAIPRLRSSRERVPLQKADQSSRFDGQMDSWPSEGEVEALAKTRRPPSRDTNRRYFIDA
ncbi:hypothetical protein M406DRAFT_69831 [Cryphonectria parasitica EP155]|uniref:Uncharacterized protein n=1 Tax=Cryphonectria parasitica (strain ATCC 38755 / EP155) TaxID=660469 RepID=A0A9P4Y748_CRYP1|nr:uncharacterized protein M406DRAFT_69831 [Cryphonectria parasitica EP155]KAF3767710.1 hypothetical protein M406DRAFT_69831 [Cryphonectria parasitica EP155]